jgi:hypothetical protein
MKLLAFFFVAALASVAVALNDSPSQITGNNVGDLVSVDVKAKAKIDSSIDVNIINVLLKLINEQRIKVGGGDGINLPDLPNLRTTTPSLMPTFPVNEN